MPGSSRLRDLPGGPPDNYGMDDQDLLSNIVSEVEQTNSRHARRGGGGGGAQVQYEDDDDSDDGTVNWHDVRGNPGETGGHLRGAGNQVRGGRDQLQDYNMPQNPVDRLGNGPNPNIHTNAQAYQQGTENVRQTPGRHPQAGYSRRGQVPASVPMKLEPGIMESAMNFVSNETRDPLIVASLMFLGNMDFFVDLLDRIAPRALKILGNDNRETTIGSMLKALFIGVIFYLLKKFVFGVEAGNLAVGLGTIAGSGMGQAPYQLPQNQAKYAIM